MSKQQTAVEWLVEQFEVSHSYINEIFKESIEQAKGMEKEQLLDMGNQFAIMGEDSPEQYYNETYGK